MGPLVIIGIIFIISQEQTHHFSHLPGSLCALQIGAWRTTKAQQCTKYHQERYFN
ncbi:hypothetical protein GPLA_1737 [Paraglaciecola polaris LMG 21857]|uniref:Uncharacterized protein n=1 Tax=Paraglaciecola polaris LMG 21857 TaxID=1129793 RepID=K6ZQT4_9ALTE|nr:hypothetical protein GPLA_1737 [Paraglaciecola polaris LMG 21857]